MSKDLREMFKNEPRISDELSKNHRKKFENKLFKEMHSKKRKMTKLVEDEELERDARKMMLEVKSKE